MVANNKMALSHYNSIAVSNGQQLPMMSAHQSSVKFIHLNIA